MVKPLLLGARKKTTLPYVGAKQNNLMPTQRSRLFLFVKKADIIQPFCRKLSIWIYYFNSIVYHVIWLANFMFEAAFHIANAF